MCATTINCIMWYTSCLSPQSIPYSQVNSGEEYYSVFGYSAAANDTQESEGIITYN